MFDNMMSRLIEERKRNQLTQRDVANLLNVTEKYISFLETGIRRPSLDLFLSLCKLYKSNINYIVYGDSYEK